MEGSFPTRPNKRGIDPTRNPSPPPQSQGSAGNQRPTKRRCHSPSPSSLSTAGSSPSVMTYSYTAPFTFSHSASVHSPVAEPHSPISPIDSDFTSRPATQSLLKMATIRAFSEAKGHSTINRAKPVVSQQKADVMPQSAGFSASSELALSPTLTSDSPKGLVSIDVDAKRSIQDILELDGVHRSPRRGKPRNTSRGNRSRSTGDMYDMISQARLYVEQLLELKAECDEYIRKAIVCLRSADAQSIASSQPIYRGYVAQICDIGTQIINQPATSTNGHLLRERIERILQMQTRWMPQWPGQNAIAKVLFYMAQLASHAVSTVSEFNATVPKVQTRTSCSSPVSDIYLNRPSGSPASFSSDWDRSPQNPGTPVEEDENITRGFPGGQSNRNPQLDQISFTNYIAEKLSKWNASKASEADDRRDTSTPDHTGQTNEGEGNAEEKDEIVCRICEEDVPKDKLRMHSRFCVIYQKTIMKITGIDEKLQNQLFYVKKQLVLSESSENGSDLLKGFTELKRLIEQASPPFGPETHQAIAVCNQYVSEAKSLAQTFSSYPVFVEACENYERVLNNKRDIIRENLEASRNRDSLNDAPPVPVPSVTQTGTQSPIPSPGTITPRTGKNALSATYKDFHFIKPISRGAFGRVFLARKIRTGDLYAIKVLNKEEMVWRNQIERVKAEQKILAGAENPFVVKLFYSFETKDKFFLVMEYIQGGDCYSLLKHFNYLEESQSKIYIAEVVLALEYLHGRGIIHRDLKPDNMLINREGHIKLTDFGLSRYNLMDDLKSKSSRASNAEGISSGSNPSSDTLPLVAGLLGRRRSTRTYEAQQSATSMNANTGLLRGSSSKLESRISAAGNVSRNSCVGTPDYLAPEIILGTQHGPLVDWWALGVVLYELLIGIPPFHADARDTIFENILKHNIEWPDEDDGYVISDEAKDFISKLLVVDQKKRLGASGASEIKDHPFFRDIDWDSLPNQKGPFVPQPSDGQDTSYFICDKGTITISIDEKADLEEPRPKPSTGADERKDETVKQETDTKAEKSTPKYETEGFNFINLRFLDRMNEALAQEASLHRKKPHGSNSPTTQPSETNTEPTTGITSVDSNPEEKIVYSSPPPSPTD